MLNYSHQVTFMVGMDAPSQVGCTQQHSILKLTLGICVISPRHGYPEGMSKLHKEVAEMSMVPLLLYCLLSPISALGLMQSPYHQLTEEAKAPRLGL